MRLIDVDKLLRMMSYWKPYMDMDKVRHSVKCMPTIDAVPVVRCKDCKHWDYGDCYRLKLSHPDDFCSYGERRTEI